MTRQTGIEIDRAVLLPRYYEILEDELSRREPEALPGAHALLRALAAREKAVLGLGTGNLRTAAFLKLAAAVPAPVSSAKRASAATMRPPASARAQPGRGSLPGTVARGGGGVVTLRVLRIGRERPGSGTPIVPVCCLVIIGADGRLAHRESPAYATERGGTRAAH